MVNTNHPATMRRFQLVHGDVTIEAWMRPKAGQSTNNALSVGNHLDGFANGEWARNTLIINKNDKDLWFYNVRDRDAVNFAVFDGDWHHVRLVCHTPRNSYDLYFDNELVEANIPTSLRMDDGISIVGFTSGRWGGWPDAWSYFDEVRVFVGEPTREVGITVRPTFGNELRADAATRLTVAVLSNAAFDATTAVTNTVRFGPKNAAPLNDSVAVEDVDDDGRADWSAVFFLGSSGIGAGTSVVGIRGQTKDGNDFVGRQSIYALPVERTLPLDPNGRLTVRWASLKRR